MYSFLKVFLVLMKKVQIVGMGKKRVGNTWSYCMLCFSRKKWECRTI